MRNYVIKRVLLIIPTLLLVSIIVFIMVRLIPGDLIDLMASEMQEFTQMDRARIERALGLDQPMYIQYFRWAGDIFLHGNLGKSLWSSTSVKDEIIGRLPVTLELTFLAMVISTAVAIPIGIYSAVRQDTKGDYIARIFATAGIALPDFWVATMVIVFGSMFFGWSPALRITPFFENPLENLSQFIMPALILGMHGGGVDMRLTRAMMLEVLKQDYVRTAWAKGLRERVVIIRHALRNAMIPVVTNLGLRVPTRVGGTVILENIFGLPGIGRLIVEATNSRDYTMVSGVVLFLAIVLMGMNLIVDLTYGLIDPRVRYK